jgi:hypothetical protein
VILWFILYAIKKSNNRTDKKEPYTYVNAPLLYIWIPTTTFRAESRDDNKTHQFVSLYMLIWLNGSGQAKNFYSGLRVTWIIGYNWNWSDPFISRVNPYLSLSHCLAWRSLRFDLCWSLSLSFHSCASVSILSLSQISSRLFLRQRHLFSHSQSYPVRLSLSTCSRPIVYASKLMNLHLYMRLYFSLGSHFNWKQNVFLCMGLRKGMRTRSIVIPS